MAAPANSIDSGRNVFDQLAMGASVDDIMAGKSQSAQDLVGIDTSPDAVMRSLDYHDQMEARDDGNAAKEAQKEDDNVASEEAEADNDPGEENPEDIDAGLSTKSRSEEQTSSKKKSAQDRIREVIGQRNEAVEHIKELTSTFDQKLTAQQQTFQQQFAMMQQQNQYLMQQLGEFNQRARAVEEEGLDPVEKFKREVAESQRREVEAKIKEALAPFERKQLEDNQREVERQKQETQRTRMANFEKETITARNGVVLKDFGQKSVEDIGMIADELILNYASAFNKKPTEAAHELAKFLDKYHKARIQAENTKSKNVVDRTRTVGSVITSSRAPANGQSSPKYTKEQLVAVGYRNYFHASTDGFRRMTRQ